MKYIVEKYFKKFNVAQTSYLECLLGRVCQWVFLMQKYKKEPRQNNCSGSLLGGPDRIRTDDPHNANVVRSQGGKFSAHGLRHVGRLYNVRMDYNFLAKTRTANDALKVLHIRFIQLCLE